MTTPANYWDNPPIHKLEHDRQSACNFSIPSQMPHAIKFWSKMTSFLLQAIPGRLHETLPIGTIMRHKVSRTDRCRSFCAQTYTPFPTTQAIELATICLHLAWLG
jgi:hypothetical protein